MNPNKLLHMATTLSSPVTEELSSPKLAYSFLALDGTDAA